MSNIIPISQYAGLRSRKKIQLPRGGCDIPVEMATYERRYANAIDQLISELHKEHSYVGEYSIGEIYELARKYALEFEGVR